MNRSQKFLNESSEVTVAQDDSKFSQKYRFSLEKPFNNPKSVEDQLRKHLEENKVIVNNINVDETTIFLSVSDKEIQEKVDKFKTKLSIYVKEIQEKKE